MLQASKASVIDAIRSMMVEFKGGVDREEPSGTDDGSAVLDPSNADVGVAGGNRRSVPAAAAAAAAEHTNSNAE